MAEELIYKVGVEGTNELDKLEKSVDKAGKSTGKTKLYMSELRNELRKARGDMIKYAEGTEEYNRALNKGARITQQINDANSKMRISVQDLGDTTKNITGTMVGFAGGFQVVQSAMSLFGIENEETIKTVLKLQQTMSIVQGMSAFAQSIGDMQDLLGAFRASNDKTVEVAAGLSGSINNTGKSMDEASDSAEGLSDTVIETSSNLAGATNAANDLGKGLDNVDKSLGDVKEGFSGLAKGITVNEMVIQDSKIRMMEYDRTLLEAGSSTKELSSDTQTLMYIKKAFNADKEAQLKIIDAEIVRLKSLSEANKEIHKQTKETTEVNKEAEAQTKKNTKATEDFDKANKGARKGITSFAKSVLKSLGTMAAFLAVIWAVTAAVSWMIKKFSEVPEDIKIKLELETTALNDYTNTLTKIRNFVREYNQALKDGNTALLAQMDKVAIKEYQKHQADLDNIKERGEMTEDFFNAYLQMAKDTYYNEALAKLKSEKEVALLIAKEEEKSALLAWEADKKRKMIGRGFKDIYEFFGGGTRGDIKKARKDIIELNKEIDALSKIEYKPVKSPFVDEDAGGGGGDTKTPAGKAPTLQDKRPDKAGDKLEIDLMGERLLAKRGLSHQERELEAESARFTDKNQSDSYLRYAEHQQRMAIARDKDLGERKEYLLRNIEAEEESYSENLRIQNEALEAIKNGHDKELGNLQLFNQKKFDIEAEAQALLEGRQDLDGKKDAAEIKAIDDKIEALNRLYKANNDNIGQSKEHIQAYKDRAAAINEELKALDASPEKIKLLKDELVDLNLAIADSNMALKKSIVEVRDAQLENAKKYIEQIGDVMYDLEAMSGAMMQAEDNKLAKQKNSLEASQAYREADSEQQQQMMYELEEASYAARKKAFDRNKAFQMGQVIVQFAANEMDIIKALLNPATGGPLSPVNIGIAAATTALNLATMTSSLKQIASTSLDKPVPPGGGASGGAGAANIALSPNKTGLTSKEENLNSMYKSGKSEEKDTIVKVSEINNVQNKVKVREKNSSY